MGKLNLMLHRLAYALSKLFFWTVTAIYFLLMWAFLTGAITALMALVAVAAGAAKITLVYVAVAAAIALVLSWLLLRFLRRRA